MSRGRDRWVNASDNPVNAAAVDCAADAIPLCGSEPGGDVGKSERQQKATPSQAGDASAILLIATAVVLVGSQWMMAHLSPGWAQAELQTIADAVPVVLLLGVPAMMGLALAPRLSERSENRLALALMVLVGLAMRLVWYGVPVLIDDDYFRYLWDGAVLAWGHNPYTMAPKAALDGIGVPPPLVPLAAQAGDVLRGINFPELSTIYPGTSQLAFALAYGVAPLKLDGLRLVFLGAELATLALLLVIVRDLGRPMMMTALYWLNPLVVWSSHGTGHTEVLMAPLVLGACLAAWRGRGLVTAALVALGVGVKIWPILLVPLLARLLHAKGRSLLGPALVLAGGTTLLMLPLLLSAVAAGTRSGLVAYSEHWWVNNAPFSWISYWVYQATSGDPNGQRALRAAIALFMGVLALAVAYRPANDLRAVLVGALTIAAATFYLAPAQFPWYALWFLPLAAAVENRPLLAASATLSIYYFFIPLVNQGLGHWHTYGVAGLHAAPVLIWLLVDWLDSHRARPQPTNEPTR